MEEGAKFQCILGKLKLRERPLTTGGGGAKIVPRINDPDPLLVSVDYSYNNQERYVLFGNREGHYLRQGGACGVNRGGGKNHRDIRFN